MKGSLTFLLLSSYVWSWYCHVSGCPKYRARHVRAIQLIKINLCCVRGNKCGFISKLDTLRHIKLCLYLMSVPLAWLCIEGEP